VDWGRYGQFVAFAIVLVLVPGPDFAVTVKNTLAGGRRRGTWTATGIATSNAVQGTAAALGLGALVLRAQPVFDAIRVAGICYLFFLAAQALRSAVRGRPALAEDGPGQVRRIGWSGWRQGFLSNITNPKVLVFYLAVLPQFMTADATTVQVLALALTHALLSLSWLCTVVLALDRFRGWLTRRRVRRAMDAATGTVLLGFGVRLAAEHP
jgi:threonine/homoserine/homoserine lactone efflux protein